MPLSPLDQERLFGRILIKLALAPVEVVEPALAELEEKFSAGEHVSLIPHLIERRALTPDHVRRILEVTNRTPWACPGCARLLAPPGAGAAHRPACSTCGLELIHLDLIDALTTGTVVVRPSAPTWLDVKAPAAAPPARRAGEADPVPAEVAAARQDPARRLGRYVLVRELGRGGMGVVYQAWDDELSRWVAVKVILGERASADDVERFKREARLAARVEHPNIAPVHDVGEVGGQQYIVMKFVEGTTLDQACAGAARADGPAAARQADLKALVAAVRDAARGVGHAHRHGIIHRDLKPSNIMVDRAGPVYVLDFGLGKSLAAQSATLTGEMAILGTPAFMAPEQARGLVKEIDARADVYALGATLYERLTCALPHPAETTQDMLVRIATEPPPSLRRTRPDLPGALDAIVQKAMARDKADRYPTAVELADALDGILRVLDEGPAVALAQAAAGAAAATAAPAVGAAARPAPARRPAAAGAGAARAQAPAAAAAAAAAAAGRAAAPGAVAAVPGAVAAKPAAARAARPAWLPFAVGGAILLVAVLAFSLAGRGRTGGDAARGGTPDGGRPADPAPTATLTPGPTPAATPTPGPAPAVPGPEPRPSADPVEAPGRAFPAALEAALAAQARAAKTDAPEEWEQVVTAAAAALARAGSDEERQAAEKLRAGAAEGRTRAVARKDAAEHFAAAMKAGQAALDAGDPATAAARFTEALAARPGDAQAAAACTRAQELDALRRRDREFATCLEEGRKHLQAGDRTQARAAFSRALALRPKAEEAERALADLDRDEHFAAAMAAAGAAAQGQRWEEALQEVERALAERPDDPEARKRRAELEPKVVLAAIAAGQRAFDEGNWDAARAAFGRALVLRPGDGAARAALDAVARGRARDLTLFQELWSAQHEDFVVAVAFSPDGKVVASAGGDRKVRVWDAATGAARGQLAGHRGEVVCLLFSPDGRRLYSGGRDQGVKIWDWAGRKEVATLDGPGEILAMALAAPGGRLLAFGGGGKVKLWDLQANRQVSVLSAPNPELRCALDFSPDGRFLAWAGNSREVRIWNLQTGEPAALPGGETRGFPRFGRTPAGRLLALTGCDDRTVRVLDWGTKKELEPFPSPEGAIQAMAFTPDEKILAFGTNRGKIELWRIADRKPLRPLDCPAGQVWGLAVSPDGTRLAAGCTDHTLRVFGVRD